jgi:hypothetical protein
VFAIALQVDALLDARLPEDMVASPNTLHKAHAHQEGTEVVKWNVGI